MDSDEVRIMKLMGSGKGHGSAPGSHLSTRRQALGICAGCALANAVASPPRCLAATTVISVGALDDYTRDEISEEYIRYNFFVIRHEGRLFATIATCPHQENYLLRNVENRRQIICTEHDAVFDPAGRPLSGPVRKGLERYGITVDDEGVVQVDTSIRFSEEKWDEDGSFISLLKTESGSSPASPGHEKENGERVHGELREWSDSTGDYRVKAHFVSLGNGKVTLKRVDNGELIEVPLSRLSETDQQWIRSRNF